MASEREKKLLDELGEYATTKACAIATGISDKELTRLRNQRVLAAVNARISVRSLAQLLDLLDAQSSQLALVWLEKKPRILQKGKHVPLNDPRRIQLRTPPPLVTPGKEYKVPKTW